MGNDDLKRHFFVEVNGVLVFKLQDFRFFLDKHSVNNSYTKYANRIGLTDGSRFLKDNSDIVLDFPFKDCVLNGGQSTEEGEEIYFKRNNDQSDSQLYTKLTQKRQEIFFNQTLAFDEIDRLFDAKAFSKFSRYTADGKQAVGEIKRHSDGFLKGVPAENLIIKGNNLIALHSLAKQFKGKIKLIYIDPPYNTGNDGFKYNDKFNHSTWLTFMKNRLEIAKTLLADDGVIFVQCDDNEQAYLKILMDELFHHRETIVALTSTASGVNAVNVKRGEQMFKLKEYILFYSKSPKFRFNPLLIKSPFNSNYKYEVIFENGEYVITDLKSKMNNTELEEYCLNNPKNIFSLEKNNSKAGEKIKQVIEISKTNNKEVIEFENSFGKTILVYDGGVFIPLQERILTEENKNFYGVLISDLWIDEVFQTSSSEGGVTFKKGKKPEKLIKRIIELTTNENDIILDYHLGSGTTAAVAHKMNRQYIGIEQMDYIETLAVERLKKVIDSEQNGISKAVNWQGGGEFVYAELAPFNETAKQQILACEDSDGIKTLFDELCERYFLKYNVSVNEFSQIIEEPEFQSLPLDEQKQMVLEMLDLNQMYVSLSEMDDEQFAGCLNDDDKALSRAFYQSVKNQAEKKDGE
ncbi:DNA methyltransferase [Haemophilus influenzae]|uniref:DNA methyltransferase n=1 Tax=Haemophilus influenzae TaxID=727 RepID=UPI003D15D9D4